MERSQVLDASRRRRAFGTTSQLKLYGTKAAYDEIITSCQRHASSMTAVKRQHEPQQIVHCPAGDCEAICREGATC